MEENPIVLFLGTGGPLRVQDTDWLITLKISVNSRTFRCDLGIESTAG